jgi:glucose-1-phosphate thymidylyltransferase
MLMLFPDTLIETDFSFLPAETAGGVTWVKPVPDPRRFGVASVGEDGWVTHLVEKPKDMDNNLVLVGCYYLQNSQELIQAIDEQIKRDISLKNEFFFADAINIMLERGLKMRTQNVVTWLDAGTAEDVLSTNRYLLEHGQDNSAECTGNKTAVIVPPVFIDPSAMVENSVIGPHAAIGANCEVRNSIVCDSIIDDFSTVTNVTMEHSLIGQYVRVQQQAGRFNVGDHTDLSL